MKILFLASKQKVTGIRSSEVSYRFIQGGVSIIMQILNFNFKKYWKNYHVLERTLSAGFSGFASFLIKTKFINTPRHLVSWFWPCQEFASLLATFLKTTAFLNILKYSCQLFIFPKANWPVSKITLTKKTLKIIYVLPNYLISIELF